MRVEERIRNTDSAANLIDFGVGEETQLDLVSLHSLTVNDHEQVSLPKLPLKAFILLDQRL